MKQNLKDAIERAERYLDRHPDASPYAISLMSGLTQYRAKKLIGKRNKSSLLFPPEVEEMKRKSIRKGNYQDAVNYLIHYPNATVREVMAHSGLTYYRSRKLIESRQTPVETLMSPPPTSEGRKDDHDKLPWHLLPPDALNEIVNVLAFGANKYGDRNWERGMNWSRPFAALMRHMWAWWRGEDRDPETGLSHLAHAGCCLLFLLTYQGHATGKDDRPHGRE